MKDSRRTGWMAILLAFWIASAVSATWCAYRPGLMTWDAMRQYDQAISGEFDDWHPPAMEWLWRQLAMVQPGPAPMLLLQLALFWGGLALLAAAALRRGRGALAMGILACGSMPFCLALTGAVLKDCLMAGTLLSAAGLLAWRDHAHGRRSALLVCATIILLLCAATLRFNAFLGGLPLLVALLPPAWTATRRRFISVIVAATALLLAAMPVANRLIGATPSGVELSLVIFDLGGITEFSGTGAFPPLPDIADPVAVNHHCYTPVRWDSYSWWVDNPCRIGFETVGNAFRGGRIHPYLWLARAIVAHPIAYTRHRLAHFNINSRFLVHGEIERPVQAEGPPNDWGYRVTSSALLTAIDGATLASTHTPLGWPIVWISVAFGLALIAPALPSRRLIVPLAWSALLYGLGYGVFSVAAELRYHLWTILAAAIALAMAIDDLADGAKIARLRLIAAFAPALVVTALCIAWRIGAA